MKKTYIPSPEYLTSMYAKPEFKGRWVVMSKIPIDKIKVDKTLFSHQNEVNWADVKSITENFEIGAWFPIMVNPNLFLLDGQHRLAAAKKMKLKYLDVVVDNGEQPATQKDR
ncbi:MAG TPA: ParB/RepB/Spo0J family partition protein [Anaerolineales bacterium]|nr:hypothetical protein [Anaerolineae bacterium]HRK89090.1 ParB/RepB/Spo0J family partition protein [Anaerolineales bacterium]